MATLAADTLAVTGLRYYFNAAGFSLATFDMFVAYYRQQGSFMKNFGEAIRATPLDKAKAAMESLAKKQSGYPAVNDFFESLAKYVGTPTAGEVASAAGAGVVDAGKAVFDTALDFGKSSLMLYVFIAAAGTFLLPAILKNAKIK